MSTAPESGSGVGQCTKTTHWCCTAYTEGAGFTQIEGWAGNNFDD